MTTIGGVPKVVVCDNLKAGVTKRYGLGPLKPSQKVEASVPELETHHEVPCDEARLFGDLPGFQAGGNPTFQDIPSSC